MLASHFQVLGHGQDAEVYYDGSTFNSAHQAPTYHPPNTVPPSYSHLPPTQSHSTSAPPSSPRLPSVYQQLGFDQARDATPPPNEDAFKLPSSPAPQPKEPPAKEKKTASKTKFGPTAIKDLVAVMVEKDPWNAKHGKKGEKWKEGCEELWKMGHFQTSSAATIQHKMEGLMDWKDGKRSTSCQVIENEMTQSMFIQTAGCLERAVWLRDDAKRKAKEKKDADSKKEEEDEAGGKSIRDASMTVFKHQHESPTPTPSPSSSPSPSPQPWSSSVQINISTPPASPSKSRKRARDTDDDVDRSAKRHAVGRGSAARQGLQELAAMLKKSEKRQEKLGKELVGELKSANQMYGQKTSELIDVLREWKK